MVGAVREITINEGIDPRELAGGGRRRRRRADDRPKIAEELGCDNVLVPQTAAALSAMRRPVRRRRQPSSAISRRADTNRFDYGAVNDRAR